MQFFYLTFFNLFEQLNKQKNKKKLGNYFRRSIQVLLDVHSNYYFFSNENM